MFTGIVQEIGVVKSINFAGEINKLKIECKKIFKDIKLGDSIAVNGACLTVCNLGEGWFEVDVMPETIRKTSLRVLKLGQKVNLEASLRLGEPMGGHIVSGHIDDIGIIRDIKEEKNALWLIIKVPKQIIKYIVNKGSVAIEGTSLTVALVEDDSFGVSLIPTTRDITILGGKQIGDKVNIECDIIGKYIEKLSKYNNDIDTKENNRINIDFLQQNGFA